MSESVDVVVTSEEAIATTTTVIADDNKVDTTPTASTSQNAETADVPTSTADAESPAATKDNLIEVVNKVEPDKGGGGNSSVMGEVKILQKPLTVTQVTSAATLAVKKSPVISSNTIVKMQKTVTPQAAVLGKRNIVIASRPGTNQIITCAPVIQQTSHGSTPVILTQKVATGGVVTSPIVSTGGINSSLTNITGLNAKVISSTTTSQTQPQQRLQDVRVDNWGNYCLQRLQTMYEKGDYCDLTLRFHSSQEIKVHRVVVNLCTEYFSNLEKLYGLNEGTLILPKDVEFQTMQTIIKFFYAGKLEVRGTQFNDIYRTVKMMNITILIKLLEAHSRKPTTQVKKEAGRSVVLKQAVDLGRGQKGQVQIQVATAGQPQTVSPVIAVPVAGAKALQVAAPGVKLPPGMKTKTVLARVQSQITTTKGPTQSPAKSTPKKLPIWKERKYTPVSTEPPPLEKWQIKEEEVARPTRFEWGDPDEMDPFMSSTLTNHALMEKQKEKHSTRKAEDMFDSVKSLNQSGVKRTRTESETASTSSPEQPPSKMSKVEVPNLLSVLDPPDSSDNPDVQNSVDLNEDTVIEEVITSTPEVKPVERKPIPILKPALKSPGFKSGTGQNLSGIGAVGGTSKPTLPPKTVRFAPEVEKENKEKASQQATSSISRVETPVTIMSDGGQSDPLANHSKIITEVLRKFPDLVKDNKNIKLKIVQKAVEGSSAGSSSKDAKSKVSYIVLKSTSSSDSSASTVLKKSSTQTAVSKFWDTDKTPKKPSPAENTTGPWLCESCGEGENTALQFDTYRNFRRHLVDVHKERIDARICEYCGQKASKRNLLLYHLYTKHGVQPPKNCTFPHCDRCDYVALSESLLNKHRQNHDVNKEFSCSICNASFKSSTALQGHMAANLHRNKDTKVYECPYCRKPFVRNINLKAHIRSLHRDVARLEEMEDPRLPPDDSLTNRIITTTVSKKRQFPSILATARGSSHTGMVEFVTADSLSDGQTVSYVTADGQPIEILDPSTLSSLPLTLVSSGEDGMTAVGTSMGATLDLDGHSSGTAEYVTGIAQDGQAVYVMDGSQGGMEIDMSNMGLTLAADGTVVYDGEEAQNFIVQDMQGNQFRRMTGIDETGKPVVFLQMIGEAGQVSMTPTILEESISVDGSTAGSSQMFVSSAGSMSIPVSSDGSEGQQVIFASASADGTLLEMVPSDSGSHQVVMSEAVLAAHGQQIDEQQHLQLVEQGQNEGMSEVIHDQMGQPVQELHIVLDQQESSRGEGHEEVSDEGLEIVEVQQSETYITDVSHGELQLGETYTQVDAHEMDQENVHESTTDEGTCEQVEIMEEVETQQLEIEENEPGNSSQSIHSTAHSLKLEACESQEMDVHSEETQIIHEGNVELVEGQTLTFVEEEDGTQTIKCVDVDDTNVEEITS